MSTRVQVCSLLAATLLLAPGLGAFPSGNPSEPVPLGVQTCDTQCQSQETDCDLACDQVAACVDECRKVSDGCVQKCHEAPLTEAKPAGSAKAPAAPPKKPPAKTPAPKAKPKAG